MNNMHEFVFCMLIKLVLFNTYNLWNASLFSAVINLVQTLMKLSK